MKSITVDGVKYIAESDVKASIPAKSLKGMKYVIVRTYSAGVFAGYLKKKTGKEVVITNARRLWYWDGANSLSQLAEEGVKVPENCKFPQEVSEITLTEAIEILDVSKVAQENIAKVPVWKK